MTSRRKFFTAAAALSPLSVGADPSKEPATFQIRPYTAWECSCGYAMITLPRNSSTGISDAMKCVNSECPHFDKLMKIPTITTILHEPQT